MSRRPRFHLPSSIYHIMLRGNDGQAIFHSNADRCRMCLLMQEGKERFGHLIHSFCFMNNHIHVAIQVGDVSISHIIQNLAFRYTRYFNRKYNRIGHLFQGRFKSVIVEGDRYFKELIRYIHLNPVRANLVSLPQEYEWSSHKSYLMLNEYTWLSKGKLLNKFGILLDDSIKNYESFILKGIGLETELDFKSGFSHGILADTEFVKDFLNIVERNQNQDIKLQSVVEVICERFNLSEEILCSPGKNRSASHARAILALFVRENENLSLENLAKLLGRDPSGLSKLANRLESKCMKFPSIAAEINDLRNKIHILQMSECQA